MTLLKHDTRHYTYADYLTWSDSPDSELVNGTVYVREPSPVLSHQAIVLELGRQAADALEQTPCRVFVAPVDVLLPKSTEAVDQVDTVVQPDVLIVSDLRKLDDVRVVRGAPDWIAEVLSPSTARYDRTVKLRAYERAGVREVWLVHPIDRTVAIYRLEEGRYGRATLLELKGKTPLTAVPGVTIDWDRLLAKL